MRNIIDRRQNIRLSVFVWYTFRMMIASIDKVNVCVASTAAALKYTYVSMYSSCDEATGIYLLCLRMLFNFACISSCFEDFFCV